MYKISTFALLFSASFVAGSVLPRQAGTQFITGVCKSDADCASGCCGFNTGKCAGPVVAQERDGGCGFGDAQPNDRAAVALGFPSRKPAAPAQNGGGAAAPTTPAKAPGTQFITGACTSDADCASACCGFTSGKCAGPVVAQERDGGCGFGDAQPNDRAAVALGFPSKKPAAQPAAQPANNAGNGAAAGTTPAKAPGTQFITGVCTSDADCASACCGFTSGKCAGPVVAQERDGGCGFGDAQPNDRAAVALGFPSKKPAASTGGAAATTPAKAPGTQFITGACTSDADCASACCGFTSGKCAGPIVAQERDGGCGFGDAQPNDRAAKALRGRADPERYLL